MSLQQELMAIERTFWTGGPKAYEDHTDEECLVVFTDMAGIMSRHDIAKTAEQGRWKDVALTAKGMAELAETSAVVTYECAARRKFQALPARVVAAAPASSGGPAVRRRRRGG